MCYYNSIRVSFIQRIKLLELEREIKAMLSSDIIVRSGFEYNDWPIIKPVDGGKDIELAMAHWEFIPAWVPTIQAVVESRKKFIMLNAVGEELFEKKAYKDAAMKRRCLILSSGFYEWRHYKPEGSKKDIAYPYYINLPGKDYFYMAGIWQPWTDRESGETIDTFALVTTKANSLMEQVHNKKKRMPTILPDELAREWIMDGLSQERITQLATYQIPSIEMAACTINKDFKAMENPVEPFEFEELPGLV